MKEIEHLARMTCRTLEQGIPVVIASIISLQGSSPRHMGTKMVIAENSQCYGTIGGSLLEWHTIKEARDLLKQRVSRILSFDLAGQGADAPGMICGGTARILLEYVIANPANREFFKQWLSVLSSGQNHYLLTGFRPGQDTVEIAGRSIVASSGQVYGSFLETVKDYNIQSELRNHTITSIIPVGEIQVMVDPIRRIQTVYCFGAGHVAVPTAKIAAMAGFRVVVFDDRAEFASLERFPEAQEVRVIESFKQAFAGLAIDVDSYIVIVTRGHQFDQTVLEGALQTQAGYIGMISSRAKREAIYKALLEKGVKKEQLEKVHSPIGIPIGGETPEEIAVSIVAELISVRWKQQANR